MTTPEYGSDLIVDLLVGLDVDVIPFAPGATFRGLHDSLINYRADAPEIIECLHEEISVAVAHGYAKASGKLTAVALHDVVGLQHAAMAIYNAWCDRVPLLAIGATGPVDAAQRRPWIDWIHTANVQATQVRDYTKWDDQPASIEAVQESFVRARQLAASTPQGPVYICLDTTVQEDVVPADLVPLEPRAYPVARPLSPDPDAVEVIAGRLVAAQWPLIAVESVERDQSTFDALVELSEILGVAVTEVQRDYNRTALCLPTRHPHNLSGMVLPQSPDVVLALEVRDVAVVPGTEHAAVLQVSTAGLAPKAWAADLQRVQPSEVLVAAEVGATLRALTPAVARLLAEDRNAAERARARADALRSQTARQWADWESEAELEARGTQVTPAALALAVDRATRDHDRVLANGSLHNWVHRLWSIDRVDAYLGSSGGAGLGYGLGASVGAALAHRRTGRLVVDLQSDGDALMTPSALWTAAHHRAPLLIVVENNHAWGNSLMHAERIADYRGRSRERIGVGTRIVDPEVQFTTLARSMGIDAVWSVSRQEDLADALANAVRTVTESRVPALVDVTTVEPEPR